MAKKKIIKKIVVFGSVIILLTALGVGLYVRIHLTKIVEEKLQAKVAQLTDGFYQISVDEIRIELFRGRFAVEGIALYPDSNIFNRLQAVDSLPSVVMRIKLPVLELSVFNVTKALKSGTIGFEHAWFREPAIEITKTRQSDKKNIASRSSHKRSFRSLNIDHINIDDGNVVYSDWKSGDTTVFKINGIDLELSNFMVDSAAMPHQKPFFSDNIQLSIGKFEHLLPGGLFAVEIGEAGIEWNDSSAFFKGLKLIPQYDRKHFAAKNPRHTNWMELSIDDVQCTGIDFPKLFSGEYLLVNHIDIHGFVYTNMKNREVEQAPIVKPMLYEYVHRLPIRFLIQTIRVEEGRVIYEDLPVESPKSGIVTLDKMEGTLYHITNELSPENKYMVIDAKAYVQGEGILTALFRFPVDPKNHHFEISGTMGNMHMTSLNSMLEPFYVRVNKGFVNSLDYKISGNNHQAQLDMLFLYEDLHIALLKKENGATKNILSGIVNGMVIFNGNPSQEGNPARRASTATQRNEYRASFHYFWHTLFDGMSETIGISEKKKKQLEWLKKAVAKMHTHVVHEEQENK